MVAASLLTLFVAFAGVILLTRGKDARRSDAEDIAVGWDALVHMFADGYAAESIHTPGPDTSRPASELTAMGDLLDSACAMARSDLSTIGQPSRGMDDVCDANVALNGDVDTGAHADFADVRIETRTHILTSMLEAMEVDLARGRATRDQIDDRLFWLCNREIAAPDACDRLRNTVRTSEFEEFRDAIDEAAAALALEVGR